MLYHLLTGQDFSFKKEFLFVFMEVELPCFSVDKSLASFLKFPWHTSVFNRFIKSPKLVNYLTSNGVCMQEVCVSCRAISKLLGFNPGNISWLAANNL